VSMSLMSKNANERVVLLGIVVRYIEGDVTNDVVYLSILGQLCVSV
jgi:hypothetical protein